MNVVTKLDVVIVTLEIIGGAIIFTILSAIRQELHNLNCKLNTLIRIMRSKEE